ncbi:MAG: AI-2E family transporter YdiK [Candidatus Rokuibacteriota bacterium]
MPRTILAVLCLVGLIAASFWILRPFLPAVIWATMVVVATWPLMLRVQATLWGRRWLAVTVMTIALLLVFVIPFSLAIGTIVANADEIVGWARALGTLQLPAPPDWLQAVPLVGRKAASAWRALAASGPEELGRRIAPYAEVVSRWFLAEIGSFGVMAVEFLLTVVIAAILFAAGETVVTRVRRFARRLAGAPGESVVRLAGQAIRGVALGVVLVAIGQAVLGGIGLAVAGVPFAGILTALMLLLCLAQIGPAPVLLAGVVWLYWTGTAGWGTALLVWTIVVGTVDNVVRPILIMKGADLPLLLIFTGVVGGLLAFGLVGIFVGPMVLAVAYTLLEAWVCEEEGEPE